MLLLGFAWRSFADCGVERWSIKTATDSDATSVTSGVLPTTISYLLSIPATRPLPAATRLRPVETTVWGLSATLLEYRTEDDSDYHLVLIDGQGHTMIAEVPSADCIGTGPFRGAIQAARATIEAKLPRTSTFRTVNLPVEIQGIGFFDFLHGQTGVAPNGVELHPVTGINFSPLVSPPVLSRRRSVGHGPYAPTTSCTLPTVTLSASKYAICAGEATTLSWSASDATSRVTLDGVGGFSATGSVSVAPSSPSAYSAHAANTCGPGPESVASIAVSAAASASFASSGTSVNAGTTLSMAAVVGNVGSWSISSSLGNTITPSSGTSNGTVFFSYSASRTGTDTVRLTAVGCSTVTSQTTISVNNVPPVQPQPQPPSGTLLCCDGTRSPTCTSCSSKQGCCSSHGGVCGCP